MHPDVMGDLSLLRVEGFFFKTTFLAFPAFGTEAGSETAVLTRL